MKKLFMLFALTTTLAYGHEAAPLHLDLEMTAEEYAALLKKPSLKKNLQADDPQIESAIKLGTRLGQWINLVNANRSADSAIRLTSAETRTGVPIDKPASYSPSLISNRVKEALNAMPASMREVITSNNDLPLSLGIDDKEFILHARKLDKTYQEAARYKLMIVHRDYYIQAASRDVRGYYYLGKNNIDSTKLSNLKNFSSVQKKEITDALIKICYNSENDLKFCQTKVNKAMKKDEANYIYDNYIYHASMIWRQFFEIKNVRKDISWACNTMTVPFNTPAVPKFIPYLQNNIEDEFRWNDWGLKMQFGKFPDGPVIKFEIGVLPHVKGGNQIVMDANQPIEEYESQWTIRHEFGHVLGLPDCYHEFYDVEIEAFVNYQLDITNLMCSRAGNMNERIYKELKKAYAK